MHDGEEDAVQSASDYSFLQAKSQSGEDILTKTYQLANSPYVVGRHGGENRAASVERAARKRDADSEPLDRLSLGGLGMHDGEDDAVQSAGDYSFLQAKQRSGEDILTKTYQLANSPYVVGRHGGENRAASVERAARKRDADSEPLDRLSLGGLGMHDGEEDAVQSAGDYSFLQAKSTSGEDIYTKTYQLANSPYVVGRHGGENRAASVERAARKRDADSEPLDRLSL